MFSLGPKKPEAEAADVAPEASAGPSLSSVARRKAAAKVAAALDSGDVNALDKALAAHYEACASGGEEEAPIEPTIEVEE